MANPIPNFRGLLPDPVERWTRQIALAVQTLLNTRPTHEQVAKQVAASSTTTSSTTLQQVQALFTSQALPGGTPQGAVTKVVSDANVTGSIANSTLTLGWAAQLSVSRGGTGGSSHTSHGVMVGAGTGPVAATSAGTKGQPLLSGGASADPSFGPANKEVAYAPTGAGNFSIAHGLGATPSLVLLQQTSLAPVYFQTPTRYDATNIYLVSTTGAETGFCEVYA